MPLGRTPCQVLNHCHPTPPSYLLSHFAVPYIVGCNPNSPSNPHSAAASGGNNTGTIDTFPMQEAYVLYGGVVGGPDKFDNFYDIRSDWPETEVSQRSLSCVFILMRMDR
jgi:hypothetical protein